MTIAKENEDPGKYDMTKMSSGGEEKILFPGTDTFIKSKGKYSDQLSIFKRKENAWQKIDFPPGTTSIKIGSDANKSKIVIDGDDTVDPIHTVITYLDSKIFVMERGKNTITYVNGVKTPQAVLDDNNSAFLLIGKTAFIIKPKRSVAPNAAAGQNTYLIKTPVREFTAEFNRSYLLGSNSACDIGITGDEFLGLIVPQNKNFYLFPFINLKLNSDMVSEFQPCLLTSSSNIHNLSISIHLPENMVNAENAKLPSYTYSSLKFIEILHDEKIGSIKMNLPSVRKSFFISRKKSDYSFQVESLLVSRKHAQVIVYDKSIMVEDCYSINGTFINGEKIGRKMMSPGDFLSVGDKTFLLGYSLKSENPVPE